jgi:vacuolar protein sorting-associated protein 45
MGLFSVIVSSGMMPSTIRYCGQSRSCFYIASALQRLIDEERSSSILSDRETSSSDVLIICDRREDFLTPLLTPWSYRSMIHEYLGIENNRTNLYKENKILDPSTDEFFVKHKFSSFGEIGKKADT